MSGTKELAVVEKELALAAEMLERELVLESAVHIANASDEAARAETSDLTRDEVVGVQLLVVNFSLHTWFVRASEHVLATRDDEERARLIRCLQSMVRSGLDWIEQAVAAAISVSGAMA